MSSYSTGKTFLRRLQFPHPSPASREQPLLQSCPTLTEAHSPSLHHALADRHQWCPPAFQLGPLPSFACLLFSKMIQREGKEKNGSAPMDLPESGQNEDRFVSHTNSYVRTVTTSDFGGRKNVCLLEFSQSLNFHACVSKGRSTGCFWREPAQPLHQGAMALTLHSTLGAQGCPLTVGLVRLTVFGRNLC